MFSQVLQVMPSAPRVTHGCGVYQRWNAPVPEAFMKQLIDCVGIDEELIDLFDNETEPEIEKEPIPESEPEVIKRKRGRPKKIVDEIQVQPTKCRRIGSRRHDDQIDKLCEVEGNHLLSTLGNQENQVTALDLTSESHAIDVSVNKHEVSEPLLSILGNQENPVPTLEPQTNVTINIGQPPVKRVYVKKDLADPIITDVPTLVQYPPTGVNSAISRDCWPRAANNYFGYQAVTNKELKEVSARMQADRNRSGKIDHPRLCTNMGEYNTCVIENFFQCHTQYQLRSVCNKKKNMAPFSIEAVTGKIAMHPLLILELMTHPVIKDDQGNIIDDGNFHVVAVRHGLVFDDMLKPSEGKQIGPFADYIDKDKVINMYTIVKREFKKK